MTDEPTKPGVYGENHPESDDRPEPDIREDEAKGTPDGVAEEMDATRERMSQDGPRGGMGRTETPSSNTQEAP